MEFYERIGCGGGRFGKDLDLLFEIANIGLKVIAFGQVQNRQIQAETHLARTFLLGSLAQPQTQLLDIRIRLVSTFLYLFKLCLFVRQLVLGMPLYSQS
jgi:hypothetical protein